MGLKQPREAGGGVCREHDEPRRGDQCPEPQKAKQDVHSDIEPGYS